MSLREVRFVELRNKGKNFSVEMDSILGLHFGSLTIGDGEKTIFVLCSVGFWIFSKVVDVVTCRGFLLSGLRKMCSVRQKRLLPTKLNWGGY